MVTVNGRVVLLGGENQNGENYLASVEELSLEDWTWSLMEGVEMKETRSYFSAVVVPREMVSP